LENLGILSIFAFGKTLQLHYSDTYPCRLLNIWASLWLSLIGKAGKRSRSLLMDVFYGRYNPTAVKTKLDTAMHQKLIIIHELVEAKARDIPTRKILQDPKIKKIRAEN
jgi:hypothetical protein